MEGADAHFECTIKAEPVAALACPFWLRVRHGLGAAATEDLFKTCAEHVAFGEIVVPGCCASTVAAATKLAPVPGVVYVEQAMEAYAK